MLFNSIINVLSNGSTISRSDNRFSDGLVSFVNRLLLLNLNLYLLLVNSWSDNSLFVVSVSRNIDSLSSRSVLLNLLSGDWISIDNLIRRVLVVDLNRLFFMNRLNVSLSNILISRKSVISDLWVVLNLSRSLNSRESSSNVLRRSDSDLLLDSSYSWFNEVTVDYLVSFNLYVFHGLFLLELGLSGNRVSVDNLVSLFDELWIDLFSNSGDGWLDNDFLSGWFNNLLSDNSWCSNDSFSNNLWFGRNSLGNDSWFNSNIFSLHSSIGQERLEILFSLSSQSSISICEGSANQ